MKKTISLLLTVLMLCSCSAEKPAEDIPQTEEKEEKIEIIDEVSYTDENGKFGFHKDGTPVTEAIYDKILPVKEIKGGHRVYVGFDETEDGKKIYAGTITDGKRKAVECDWENGAHYVEEKNTLYWFYESGSEALINEAPLANFSFIPPDDLGNDTENLIIRGTFDGDSYAYIKNSDGIWELYEKESAVYRKYMDLFYIVSYYWSWGGERFGIAALDGSMIIEPIYYFGEYHINGKLLFYDSFSSTVYADVIKTYITDLEGNVICDEYDYIWRRIPEPGKFILIANGKDDEGGGWWFVDDFGNKLSEKFDYIEAVQARYEDESGSGYYYKTAIVTKDGIKTEISIMEYAGDYE